MAVEIQYHAIYPTPEAVRPATGMICDEVTLGPPRTILWNHVDRIWEFNRRVGASFLFDDEKQERTRVISRSEAEVIAREDLGTELPSEGELHRMSEAGQAASGPQK